MSPSLPEHIILEEILTRLPAASLARFKFVSKSWMALFSHPNFVKSHINRKEDYLIRTCPGGIGILSRTTLTESHIEDVPASFDGLVGSVTGLVCGVSESRNCFILWNPILHVYKQIPLPKHSKYSLFGFCWDSATEDFKLVAKKFDSSSAVVYSTKTNRWINIRAFRIPYAGDEFPAVIVKGNPYWTGYFRSPGILKFEARTNRFTCLGLTCVAGKRYSLCSVNDCLARIEYSLTRGNCLELYQFNDGRGVWSKMYTINIKTTYIFTIPKCFNYSGEIVFSGCHEWCDTKLNEVESLEYEFGYELGPSRLHRYSYTPSLIILDGMKTSTRHLRDKHRKLRSVWCMRLPRKYRRSRHFSVYDISLPTYCGGNVE
ncbi:hypothetical protein DCAR_0418171 [Daucus carota subsp. sativus]|uniref:Uncharacterized protein n=1 Tax=Daucus carota subsp. sativus TaxID=79200 RepID=A0A165Z7F6_DAUCS|nr:PREDICTED: F-box/LRR-repeat/kelch-repeat protein At2g27520-like [Daucus carota subsp. sativus]WOG98826.1 hypothetical protein DCAR_0418171 [Daucus carota subsp. sativus]